MLRKHKPRLKPALARRFMEQNTRAILMNYSKTTQEGKRSKTWGSSGEEKLTNWCLLLWLGCKRVRKGSSSLKTQLFNQRSGLAEVSRKQLWDKTCEYEVHERRAVMKSWDCWIPSDPPHGHGHPCHPWRNLITRIFLGRRTVPMWTDCCSQHLGFSLGSKNSECLAVFLSNKSKIFHA